MTGAIFEAKQKLSQLVERASKGEEIVITAEARSKRGWLRCLPNAGGP